MVKAHALKKLLSSQLFDVLRFLISFLIYFVVWSLHGLQFVPGCVVIDLESFVINIELSDWVWSDKVQNINKLDKFLQNCFQEIYLVFLRISPSGVMLRELFFGLFCFVLFICKLAACAGRLLFPDQRLQKNHFTSEKKEI